MFILRDVIWCRDPVTESQVFFQSLRIWLENGTKWLVNKDVLPY